MAESDSTFRDAALASRLLTEQDLDDALSAINAAADGPPAPLVQLDDQRLSDKLVEMQRLNHWQAEQLKLGNTRFHLKDYQIIDSLGQGGMGQVFKAEHSMMGRVVAIKVLPKSRSTDDAVASFRHEIRSLAKLDHPNLVRAFDAGHDGNVHFLVTEFVPGTDLRRLVRSGGKLNQRDAATIIAKAAMGLGHAHERGLIHRDVKPGNIMVTPDGKVKVLDLGLAGFLQEDLDIDDPERDDDPREGRIVGTADYLAPEIINSPSAASRASDIYSLGCTLYYAVTRKVPFPGGSSAQKCHRHLNETPLHPRRFNQDLTDEFLDILADMMDKNPETRIQTAGKVVERLLPWTDEMVGAAMPQDEASFARLDPTPPPLPNSLFADTQEFPNMRPSESDDPSQISQGTERVSQAAQETSPEIRDTPRIPPRPGEQRRGEQPRSEPNERGGMSVPFLLLVVGLPALLLIAAVAILLSLLY